MSAPARPASASIPPIGLAVAGVRGSGGIHVVSAAIDDGFRITRFPLLELLTDAENRC